MAKIQIEINCEEKDCKKCRHHSSLRNDKWLCILFGEILTEIEIYGDKNIYAGIKVMRCQACLDAEIKEGD